MPGIKSMSIRGQSSAILDVAGADVEAFKAAVLEKYGFSPSDQYAADFVAFVEALRQRGIL